MVTLSPLACSSFASEAAIIPFPSEEVTPPVTKIYLAMIWFINLCLVYKCYLVLGGTSKKNLRHRCVTHFNAYSLLGLLAKNEFALLTSGKTIKRRNSKRSCKPTVIFFIEK